MAVQTIRGNIAAKWLTTAPVDLTAPKIATEMNSGTDLVVGGASVGERLADMDGWTVSVNQIQAPGADTMDTPSIVGETDLGTGTMTYYMDDTTHPIDDLLVEGATGYIVLMPYGETAGQHSTVCKVTVQTNLVDFNVANQPATFTVTFEKASQVEGVVAA